MSSLNKNTLFNPSPNQVNAQEIIGLINQLRAAFPKGNACDLRNKNGNENKITPGLQR